jgi:hypothetical protein
MSTQILDEELAVLYEAKLSGEEWPLPKEATLQYADYAVWQRRVMQAGTPCFNEIANWWMNRLSAAPPAPPPPIGGVARSAPLDPSQGILSWNVEEHIARRLDTIARRTGATHFTIRLAAFVALIADLTAKSTVVVATGFANRNRVELQTIVGRLLNPIHLVFCYDENWSFLQWLEAVRDHVFEAAKRGELPCGMIHEQLLALGKRLPEVQCYFTVSRDHSDKRFGNVIVSDETWHVGAMPRGLTIHIDERKPENCRISFDASAYDREEMRRMVDQFLRLLEVVAGNPELSLGNLMMAARWNAAFAEILADKAGAPSDAGVARG